MIHLKTPGEIAAMRAAGRVVAEILAATRSCAAPGVSLRQLDELGREILAAHGAGSPFLGYRPSFASTPFPGVICASVNDAVLHGIPGDYRLRDGDLLSVDCGAVLDGWAGDAAVSFTIGTSETDRALLDATSGALEAGIRAAVPGGRIGDISAAIAGVGRRAGCGINTDFGGHGIGRTMHQLPSVPNEGRARRGYPLRPGLVIAIEPWFLAGGNDGYRVDDDGWTLRSADGSQGAHFEHTVAITDDGPEVLTAL